MTRDSSRVCAALAADHPDRLVVLDRFDRDEARRIYAGADIFLMPSRFEPSGLSQLIALRYGTLPLVRHTGGLADTVRDADADADDRQRFLVPAGRRRVPCSRPPTGPSRRSLTRHAGRSSSSAA